MKIFCADDDTVSLRMLELTLRRWGHEVVVARDGVEAWRRLDEHGESALAILDWMMPGLDGTEVCRRVRADSRLAGSYLVLVTARAFTEDVVEGLDAGADDHVAKPFDARELEARIRVGQRVLRLQYELRRRAEELRLSIEQVRVLEGLLPICAQCRKIRDDDGSWEAFEDYLQRKSDVSFTHGICPSCASDAVR